MAHTVTAANTPPNLKGKHFIMVEDDGDTREFMLNVLEHTGAVVHVAQDGLKALDEIQRIASRNRPDLIMLDFMLPSISGSDIVERLKSRPELEGIPLIIVTAYPESAELRELSTLPGLDILPKPAMVSDIYKKITAALRPGASPKTEK